MSEHAALSKRKPPTVARLEASVAELKSSLAVYAREHGGRFILFGSAARREMHPDSDVDIWVDFPNGAHMEAIGFAEDACWKRGLKPDILGFGAPAGRLRQRVDEEGLVLPGDEQRWSQPMSNEDRWGDVLDAAKSAASHFRAAERLFLRGGLEGKGDEGYARRMAFYHSMQSAHTALESALKRALAALGQRPPTGSEWDKALIAEASRPLGPGKRPLLDPAFAAAADKTRGFRHFASHAYDEPFELDEARPAVEAGHIIADRIEAELTAFVTSISRG